MRHMRLVQAHDLNVSVAFGLIFSTGGKIVEDALHALATKHYGPGHDVNFSCK